MKLEFESNAVSSPLVGNHVPAEFEEHHGSPEVLEMLRAGIKSAQDGNRAEARNQLLRVTEADPRNENAWLWLASISEYPEELLVFLNNVLQINPENERALEWAKATKSLIAKTFVQRGIDAAKEDQKKFAKQCFLQAIVHDAESELAYLWLASVADTPEEKMSHLQKVLSLNPDNENALASLKKSKEQNAKALLPKANTAAISGKRQEANVLLDEIFEDAPNFEDAWMLKAHISESFDDKIAAFERVLEINPENPVARANVDSLKMFAGNSEADNDSPVPTGDFEDSQQLFSSRVPEPMGRPAAVEEAVTEHFELVEEESAEVECHEEEAVSFEDVSSDFDEPVARPADDPGFFESDDLFSLESSDDAVADSADQEAGFSEESEEAPLEQPVQFEEELFDNESEAVDHDYVSDNVDFTGDSAEEDLQADSLDSDERNNEASLNAAEDGDEMVAQAESAEDADAVEMEYQSDSSEDDAEVAMDAQADNSEEDDEVELESLPDSPEDDVVEMEAQTESPEDGGAVEMEAIEASEEEGTEQELAHGSGEPEMPSFETAESLSPEMPSEPVSKYRECQYCRETNENQAFACHSCKAIFTISDIEMILSHTKANKEVIAKSLEKMELEKSLRGVDVEELKYLGIGYLNLKDYRKGFEYLQEASKKDTNDVILVSQIDALAVRLAEIEDHEREHEPMTAGKRILVVDDSPTVRKLISGKLEKCGHEPICAVDGMDALAKINEEVPDLILLDITMPRMDGYQVCKLIRSNDATKDVPVVMISGKDGFFDKVRGRMAGTSNYITKPFGPETLMKTVNEYIQ